MFDFQPQLVGTLIELRPLAAADWPALYEAASDPGIWEVHPQRDRYTEPVFRKFFEDALASGGALVAIDRASGKIIGSSRYSTQFAGPGEIEIGWTFLARSHWGGTFNQDMKRSMIAHALSDFSTVIFRIGEKNFRSRRAIEKIGAVLTDRVQNAAGTSGSTPHVIYAMSRQSFASSLLTTSQS
jgi:RimJ/RimL family protein N-acetyltransferase